MYHKWFSFTLLLIVLTHYSWGKELLDTWTLSDKEPTETRGELSHTPPENLTTWIFEDGTFIPPDDYREAKLQGDKAYSIITDHLEGGALKKDVGRLFSERARLRQREREAFDKDGDKVWSRQLNIYGETRRESGEKNFIPFLYQGQYLDTETELAYNRFRYYSPESGMYVSQDPIGLLGSNPTIYAYTYDVNAYTDPLGLSNAQLLYLIKA